AGLARLVTDQDLTVAQAAADSLAEQKDPAAAEPILPLVVHGRAFVRAAGFRGLKALRSRGALGPALAAMRDEDANVR
ncbi:MAG: HEAT repeat domain-containing protein, partial [Mesorhizobium sp.]